MSPEADRSLAEVQYCASVRSYVMAPRLDANPPLFNACVARPVSRREMQLHPKALEADAKDVASLQNKGVWDVSTVRPSWPGVALRGLLADPEWRSKGSQMS